MESAFSFRSLDVLEIIPHAWRDISGATIDADALRKPRQRRTQQGVPLDVDLLAAGESSLKLLGKHTSSRKPPNQLQTRFRAKLRTALINQNGVGDVTESTRITQAAVAVEQRLGAVGDLAADVGLNAALAPAYPCAN